MRIHAMLHHGIRAPLLTLALATVALTCQADENLHIMLWSVETPHKRPSIEYFDYSGCLIGQCISNVQGGYDYLDAQGMFIGSTRCPTRDRIDYYDLTGRQIRSSTTSKLGDATLDAQYGADYFLSPKTYSGGPEPLDSLVLDPLEVKEND